MVAEDQLRAAQVDPDAGRAGDERRAVQHVVDGRDAEERAAGQQLDHLELGPGEKAAGGRARDQVGRRGRRRVTHDHGHRHLAALEEPATACGRDGGFGHGALFYGASWPGCKPHIPCTRSGTTLYMMRTSPGRRNGYLSWPRYFFASASMCASAPRSVASTTRPRTCT